MPKRLLAALVALIGSVVILSAQNPVSISQVGSTAVTTTVPVSGTVSVTGVAQDTSVNGLLLTQGSTTSGQKGPLVFGAVTTNPPGYATGQTSPFSLDLSGNLRVIVAGGGGFALTDRAPFTYGQTQFTPMGGAYNNVITALTSGQSGVAALTPTRDVHTSLFDPTGTAMEGQKVMAGSIPVVIASDQLVPDGNTTLQNAAVANGNGTSLSTGGLTSVMLTVNCASCSGGTTVNFEGTEDSTNYTALQAHQLGTNVIATGTAATGITEWQLPVGGVQNLRARISAYSAGTVTVTGHATAAEHARLVVNTNVLTVPANQSINLAQVNGSTVATAASGVAKVGLTDGTGTAITSTGAAIDVNIKSGGGTGGTALGDAATFTQGPASGTSFTPVGGIFTNSLSNLASGQAGVVQLTNDRMLYANVGKVGGTATSTNAGASDAGTQRVALSYDGAVTLQASQVSAVANGTTTRTTTTGLGSYTDAAILVNITGAGVATGTLQLYLEDSCDAGTTWNDLVSSNTFTFGASVTTQQFFVSGKLATSFTQGSAVLTEALAAGVARQGPFCDRLRVREKVSGISGTPTGVTYVISGVFKR